MATVSDSLKMMDQLNRSVQRFVRQVQSASAAVERLQRITKSPVSVNVDSSKAAAAIQRIRQQLESQKGIRLAFDRQALAVDLVRLRRLIMARLSDIRLRIQIQLPASIDVFFTNLQRLVYRLLAAVRRLGQSGGISGGGGGSPLQQQTNNGAQQGGNSTRSWFDNLKGIASFISSINFKAVGDAMKASDAYMSTQAGIGLIADGQKGETAKGLQQSIFEAAERSKSDYMAMAQNVVKLDFQAGDMFSGNNETIAFAELMQKAFKLSVTDAAGQQSGMDQLTKAMAAGKLQGDEFNSIMENAPMLADAIAKFTGKSKSELKAMAEEGGIAANILKGALFSSADDINAKFAAMPQTFGDIGTQLRNSAFQAFGPVIERVSQMLSGEQGKQVLANIQTAISIAASAMDHLLTAAVSVYSFFVTNWPIIEPIVMGIVTAFMLYTAVVAASALWTGIVTAAKLLYASATAALTKKKLEEISITAAGTAAQWGLNAAILACPITWIILAIIAFIVVIYAVIGAINRFAGTSLSATGIIAGAFATAFAFIANVVIGVFNGIIQYLWTSFVEPFLGIFEWILNAVNGGFNSFGDAVANLIGQVISWFLSLGKIVTKIIDAVFGTDWTSGLSTLQDEVLGWGKNNNAITINREAPQINYRFDYGETYKTGYDWGADLFGSGAGAAKKTGTGFTAPDYAYQDSLPNLDNVGKVGEVGKINDTVDISSEDLKMMRELAEMKNIQNFVSLTPTVSVTTGDINNGDDADRIVARIQTMLTEQIASSAQGVYA